MRLATMMDLMLEKMQQKTIGTFQLHVCTTMSLDGLIDASLVKRSAQIDKSAVNHRLRRPQLRDGRTRDAVGPCVWAKRATFQGSDVESDDD